MSGPSAADYTLDAALLSLYLLVEIPRAIFEEHQQALERARKRDELVRRELEKANEQRIERFSHLHERAREKETQLAQLQSLAESWQEHSQQVAPPVAAVFERPQINDERAWLDYIDKINQAVASLSRTLSAAVESAGDRQREAIGAVLAEGASNLDEMLEAYSAARAIRFGLSAEEVEVFRQTADRILKRLELTDENGVFPAELETLARDIVLAPTVVRAEALATELRFRVQNYRREKLQRHEDSLRAADYLLALPEGAPQFLSEALTRIAAGSEAMSPEIEEAAEALIEAAARNAAERQKEAAAIVLEDSLKDLGYEVGEIENTLFVDGGLVHFQKAGWDNYYVRMRVNTEDESLAFNVVRADTGETGDQQKRQDMIAEDRWCSEFPSLIKTLKARGLGINVTRLLDAGELPVQVVPAESLPQRIEEERRRKTNALKERELP